MKPADFRFAAALVLLAAAWLAMLVFGTGPLDRAIYEALYAGHRPALVAVATFFTWMGEPTVLVGASIAAAVWIWWRGHRHLALAVAAITLLARVFNELQKMWIARMRPDLEQHLVVVKTMSFPSGHSTSSMVFYLTMALVMSQGKSWRPLAVAAALTMAFMVGLSRVILGVHWPSDVIGGWSFGALWVLVTLRMAKRLFVSDSGERPKQL